MTKTPRTRGRPPRSAKRGDTRQHLIEGGLKLLEHNKSFDSLSLREVAREADVVPTAFYRHFPGMEELGLAMVEDSFRAMRQILNDVRKETDFSGRVIQNVVKSIVKHARKHRLHFRFLASERYGGNSDVRDAIRNGMQIFQSELAVDLSRFPYLRDWTTPDLHMLSALMVNSMVSMAQEILDRAHSDRSAEKELMTTAEKHLRLIVLAIPLWNAQSAQS